MIETGQILVACGWVAVILGTMCSIIATCWVGTKKDRLDTVSFEGDKTPKEWNLYPLFPIAIVLIVIGFVLGKVGMGM